MPAGASKPKLISSTPSPGSMNAAKPKLLPSTSGKASGMKSASQLAIEKVYKKAPSSAVMKQKTSLPGVTVSKVLPDKNVSKKKSAAGGASTSGGAGNRVPNSISAAAVKSANEILMQERNANSKGKTNSALAQLKTLRDGLAKELKKSKTTASANGMDDNEVICID